MTLVEVSLALAVGAVLLVGVGTLLSASLGPFDALMARSATSGQMRDLRRSLALDVQRASCCPVVPDLSPAWQPADSPILPGENVVYLTHRDAEISWRIRPLGSHRGSEVLRAVGREGQWTWRVVVIGVETLMPTTPMPATGEPWTWLLTPVAASSSAGSSPVTLVLRGLAEP